VLVLDEVERAEWLSAMMSLEKWASECRSRMSLVGWERDRENVCEVRRLALHSYRRFGDLLGLLVPGRKSRRRPQRGPADKRLPPDEPGQLIMGEPEPYGSSAQTTADD